MLVVLFILLMLKPLKEVKNSLYGNTIINIKRVYDTNTLIKLKRRR